MIEKENSTLKELEEVFNGRGEVKGFVFRQLKRSEHAYIYEQKELESGHITYEVFRRKVNLQYNCVSYPSSKGFGDYIYQGKCFRDISKAEDYFDYLNEKSLEVLK